MDLFYGQPDWKWKWKRNTLENAVGSGGKGGGDKDQFLFCTLKLRPLYAVPLGWPIVSLCISFLNQRQPLHPKKPLKMIVCLNVL